MAEPYGALAVAKLRSIAESPRLFALRCAGDVLIVAMEAMIAVVLVGRFGSIAGWRAAEVAMLVGIARLGEGMALIVGRGIDPITFGGYVRRGQFDQVLTRPVRPLLWLLTSDIEPRFAFRALAGTVVVTVAAASAGVDVTAANVGLLVAAAVSSAVFVLATLVLGAALTFRTVEGSDIANLLSNGGLASVSMPLDLYARPLRFVFTFVLPVGLFVYVPVLTVLGREGPGFLSPSLLAAMPVALAAVAGLAALAWRAGIRRYESTGS